MKIQFSAMILSLIIAILASVLVAPRPLIFVASKKERLYQAITVTVMWSVLMVLLWIADKIGWIDFVL